jgi:hypothetical protein
MHQDVSINIHALLFKSDSQETQPTVEDAKTAISQLRFQIMSKPDVSQDQNQLVLVPKEQPTKDMLVLIAFQVKLLIQLTEIDAILHLLALLKTQFNSLLIT